MENVVLENLSIDELVNQNGGNVPMAWYMCDASIEANGDIMFGFLAGLWDGLGL